MERVAPQLLSILLWIAMNVMRCPNVTDTGLAHFAGLTQMKGLFPSGTQVTDAGLEHLEGLSQLRLLNLRDTRTSRTGAAKLRRVLPDCNITGK